MSHSQLLVLFLLTVQSFSIFGCNQYNQYDFSIDRQVMSLCRIFSHVIDERVCYYQVIFLAKLYQSLPCFILYSKAKNPCYSRFFLTSYFCIPVPYKERITFLGVSSRRSCRSSQSHSTSASSVLLVGAQTWIAVDMNGFPWKQTEIILSFLRLHPSTAFHSLC